MVPTRDGPCRASIGQPNLEVSAAVFILVVRGFVCCNGPMTLDSCNSHSRDWIAIGQPLITPGFNDLMGRNLKRTAIELLIASFDDAPIDVPTQWTLFQVISLG